MITPVSEYDAIRSAVQRYVDACRNANAAALRAALHPNWAMYGVDSESTDQGATLSDFVDWVAQQSPPERYLATVSQISIDGNCAMARLVEQDYYGIDYVIYFSLVRYQSAWQIVTKTYSQISERPINHRQIN